MTQRIREEYRKAGITPPEGKGEHTLAFHRCAIKVMKGGKSKDSAYRICMSSIGRNKAVKKSHWDPNYEGPNKD